MVFLWKMTVLARYDTDKSGNLEFNEFRAAVRKGGKITESMLSERELEQLFDTVDVSVTGSISIDELTNFVWRVDTKQSQRAQESRAAAPPMEDLYEQFASSAPQLDDEEDDGISGMMAGGMDLHESGMGSPHMARDLSAWGDEEQTLR